MVANMFSHVYSMQFYSDKIIPRKMILLDIVSYIWTVFSHIASALNGNNVCMFALFGTFFTQMVYHCHYSYLGCNIVMWH
jgi:hypothetical protein